MVKSNYESIDHFLDDCLSERHIAKKTSNLAFVIVENDKIPWTWFKEKLLQLLIWNMQGGVTGAGSGHQIYFSRNIHDTLHELKNDGKTHAMVCQIGMLLCGFGDQINEKIPIQNFYEFVKSEKYMRAHILARPDAHATIHPQHFEINLTIWNGEDIGKLGVNYERSNENIHDDYTPLWIKVPDRPLINNFNPEQRKLKWFLYPHRNYEEQEKVFYDYVKHGKRKHQEKNASSEVIISNYYERRKKTYYSENNEPLKHPDKKYDVIICPASGTLAEFLYHYCSKENTKIIIYDYDELFLDIKKNILDMGLVGDDVKRYMKYLQQKNGSEYIFKTNRTPNQYESIEYNQNMLKDIENMQDALVEADLEFKVCNLLESDLSWIGNISKGKSVLFYASNIFSYYIVNMNYDFNYIKNKYLNLINELKQSKSYDFAGRSYK